MRNTNHVCTDCRVARRHPGDCPGCARPLRNIGDRYPVPRKRDHDGWRTLAALIAERDARYGRG